MKITDFNIIINKENVLELIDCYADSPVYDEVSADLEEIIPIAYEMLTPVAVLKFGDFSKYESIEHGTGEGKALFCIESVGEEISRLAADFFDRGNYVKGMLADAIADDCLFQLDHLLEERVKAICKEKNYGVIKRLEAPQDVPIEIQKTAWEVTRAEEEIGLKIKESYMLDPIKSNCQVYLLQEGCNEFRTEHDCSRCPKTECKMRHCDKVLITVQKEDTTVSIEGNCGQTLLEIFRNENIYIDAICAGRGTCGKCKVQFLEGCPIPTKEDENFFTEEEVANGWRLACKAIIQRECVVSIEMSGEEKYAVVTEYASERKPQQSAEKSYYGIAVDIGTTTIAMQLLELHSKTIEDTYTAINRQRSYGADVISRIQASNEGKKERLRQSILEDLEQGIEELHSRNHVTVKEIGISGNTTMISLLMGYSCEGLGAYPFTPVNIDAVEADYFTIFGNHRHTCKLRILPGISAFVGGDITAGLLACGFDRKEKVSILVDLGTNGEMAIGNQDKIFVTSTAAGPAFEGGNIICGTGSIPGAISHVTYKNNGFELETIGNQEASGICGTGVIDITYELLKQKLIDETGLLNDKFFEDGILLAKSKESEIRFYQKDIREIQLAKAAIRAGLETLLVNYGVGYDEIDDIYIAGGFGYKMDIDKAIGIGIFPKACKNKLKAIGNSSLKGNLIYLTEKDAKERMRKITQLSEEVSLAASSTFYELYLQHMCFSEK